jgi:hypothetical protein
MLVGTIQRTGGFVDLRMRYRRTLYASEHEALSGNFVGVGLIEQATPIFSQTGAYLEVQPASFFRPAEHLRQRERLGWGIREKCRREQSRARIDERHDFAFGAAQQPSVGLHGKIPATCITNAARDWRKQQQSIHALNIEITGQPVEIGVNPIEPDAVGIDMKKRRIAELAETPDDAATGTEQLLAFVGNDDPRARAPGKVAFDFIGEMVHVHDGALDPCYRELVEHVIDQRRSAHLDQRLRNFLGQRAHAFAKTRRQHHGGTRVPGCVMRHGHEILRASR